ncbi:MAG: hypothetical protein SCH71_17535 [Desulfobulbaceae bacterium]|jgi:hypothetical protein|nr:hypothetical protein [Desulfobulbaceae bacterium]
MKAENTISFLAELLELTDKLRELVKDYCREITAEEDGCRTVEKNQHDREPF